MSLKAELETWQSALEAYAAQDLSGAIDLFEQIGGTSKVEWNIGIILATMGKHEEAVKSFYQATELDKFLAVAWFQAGVSHFMMGLYDKAYEDFDEAFLYMRGNQDINYTQLGLAHTLYVAEILFNRGLSLIYLNQFDRGLADLSQAQQNKKVSAHDVIGDAIRERGRDYNVFTVPVGVLFKPSEAKLKNLKARDYMGKAILVAAADPNDAFTTFSGLTRLQRGQTPTGAPLPVSHPALTRFASTANLVKRSASTSAIPLPGDATPIASRMSRSNTLALSGMRSAGPTPPGSKSIDYPPEKIATLGLGRSNTVLHTTRSDDVPIIRAPIPPSKIKSPLGTAYQPNSGTSYPYPPEKTKAAISPLAKLPPLDVTYSPPSGDGPPSPGPTTPDRLQRIDPRQTLAVTELIDDYYASPGAYDDDIPADLPPIGGTGERKGRGGTTHAGVESWVKKTVPGAPGGEYGHGHGGMRASPVGGGPPSSFASPSPGTGTGGLGRKPSLGMGMGGGGGGLERSASNASMMRASPARGMMVQRQGSLAVRSESRFSAYEDDEGSAGGYYDTGKIRVKVHVSGHTRAMALPSSGDYATFLSLLCAKFPQLASSGPDHAHTPPVRFKDEDGDMLSMQDEGDFEAAVDVARVMGGKLEVWVD